MSEELCAEGWPAAPHVCLDLGTPFCCSLEGDSFCVGQQRQEWDLTQPLLTRCVFLLFRSSQKVNKVGSSHLVLQA